MWLYLLNAIETANEKEKIAEQKGNIANQKSQESANHHVKGLEENKKYTLTEITCPYGYLQAESIEFIVTQDKETQKIQMKDMPILKTIKLIKIKR